MVRTVVKVALFDAVILVALLLVLNDLSLRNSYALSRMPSTSYQPFLRVFSMVRTCQLPCVGMTLTSPSTLDWVQVLVALLLVSNLAFILSRRGSRTRNEGTSDHVAPPSTDAGNTPIEHLGTTSSGLVNQEDSGEAQLALGCSYASKHGL